MTNHNPLARFRTRATPQHDPIPGTGQVPNSAGGHAWPVDDWARLRRFLILGVDGPSWYASEQALVVDNATAVLRCIAADGARTVDEIVAVSVAGRNPRHQPVLFALALCAAADDPATRARALAAVPRVCRTGTHLFLFAGYAEQFRGWGRGLRRAVAGWYTDRDPDALAYQLVKYQERGGWSHRDLLRLAKPRPEPGSATDLALRWAVGKLPAEAGTDTTADITDTTADITVADARDGAGPGGGWPPAVPALLRAHRAALAAASADEVAALVTATRLPWEALRSEHLREPAVWHALIPSMGLGALVRNLGRMTANGTLVPGGPAVDAVLARLGDPGALASARLHPISVLSALLTYRRGRGVRGGLQWEPVAAVVDALDAAFYHAFGAVEPAGARTLLALDVSGSMDGGVVAGVPGLTPRLASAAMAAVTLATEPRVDTVAFTSIGPGEWSSPNGRHPGASWSYGLTPLPLSARQRLDDIVDQVRRLPFGGTDCSLPLLYALDRGLDVDHFVVYTDSETWAGTIHPAQALRRYRERTGIPARLTVVAMVPNGFSIADPDDAGMLDVVGFDTAAPQLMADFAGGRL